MYIIKIKEMRLPKREPLLTGPSDPGIFGQKPEFPEAHPTLRRFEVWAGGEALPQKGAPQDNIRKANDKCIIHHFKDYVNNIRKNHKNSLYFLKYLI